MAKALSQSHGISVSLLVFTAAYVGLGLWALGESGSAAAILCTNQIGFVLGSRNRHFLPFYFSCSIPSHPLSNAPPIRHHRASLILLSATLYLTPTDHLLERFVFPLAFLAVHQSHDQAAPLKVGA